jgi:hypothetical protein
MCVCVNLCLEKGLTQQGIFELWHFEGEEDRSACGSGLLQSPLWYRPTGLGVYPYLLLFSVIIQ